jgi:hypothetical protein
LRISAFAASVVGCQSLRVVHLGARSSVVTEGLEPLLATLTEKVITPAEGKAKALAEQRRMSEAELTKPR